MQKDMDALYTPSVRKNFAKLFKEKCAEKLADSNMVSSQWNGIQDAFRAARSAVPERSVTPNRPWIRSPTMMLIKQRAAARLENDEAEVKRLHRLVRDSVKADRSAWIENSLASGSLSAIRKLRRPRTAQQGRLRDTSGNLVGSDERADTMSIYLESVQWQVRPAGLVDGPNLGDVLPIRHDEFTEQEVKRIVRKLRNNRAAGPDEVPAEFWRVLAED